MSKLHAARNLATIVFCFVFTSIFAQGGYESDELFDLLGKDAQSQEVQGLKTHYSCEVGNPTHCISKTGLELYMKNNALSQIHLYKSSTVYGSYAGKLPKGLRFGMTSGEVKAKLGKASVSYSSGYCEFKMPNCTLCCWFEKDRLSEVNLTTE